MAPRRKSARERQAAARKRKEYRRAHDRKRKRERNKYQRDLMRQRRSRSTCREDEQGDNTMQHRKRRSSSAVRVEENERRKAQRREKKKTNPVDYDKELKRNRKLKEVNKNTWKKCVRQYEQKIAEPCSHACNCCGRLWYKDSVKKLDRETLKESGDSEQFLDFVFAIHKNGKHDFCQTCVVSIRKGEIPKLCLNNGLHFPEIDPKISCLNRIEERLVAPCHIFQTIWPVMGPHGQYKGKGGIVNVPVDLDTTVSTLPRPPDDSNMIYVQVARRIRYNSNYLTGIVSPVKIFDAARCLVHKPLFISHGIALSDDWGLADTGCDRSADDMSFEYDSNVEETMMVSDRGLRIAPAEGYKPKSILLNPDSEYLAFPKIFGGYKLDPKHHGKPIPYSDVAKSMLMRFDRRAAARSDYLLFMAKKLELIKLNNNVGICLRKKCRRSGHLITAGDMLDCSYVDGIVQHNDGFKVLRGVRSSGSHLEKEKIRLLATIRQFGLPTFFLTLSAADTRWPELLVQLKQSVDKKQITHEEALLLSYNERARLVQLDPCTCTLHFDRRFKAVMKTWGCEEGPFKGFRLKHHFYRIEFQQRGSPHVHMLVWLENAPVYDKNVVGSKYEVCSFIDKIITCSLTGVDEDLVNLQIHKHTKTCQKRNKADECRFGIPFFPMRETTILDPLEEDFDEEHRKFVEENYKIIRRLQLEPESATYDYETFLHELQLSESDYLLAIKSSLRRSQVFLKRKPCEMYVNLYNKQILQLMRSNIDIQFVLDPYGCASYILNYINKSDRGMSCLMESVLKEIREGNLGLKDSLRKISNAFYNNSEMSVQEACYNILQLPITHCSEDCVFIPTSPPSERVRLVKSKEDLDTVDPSSTDIFVEGLLDHYVDRPSTMDELTLAEFAANFTFTKKSHKNSIQLLNNKGFLNKRTKSRVIRYNGYGYESNPEEYFREMLMLFYPWRNESTDILEVDIEQKFYSCKDKIMSVKRLFHALNDRVMELALQEASEVIDNEIPEYDCNRPVFNFDSYKLDDPLHFVNVSDQLNDDSKSFPETFLAPTILSEAEYLTLLGKLNKDQRDYVYHIGDHFRTRDEPIYHLLTGGAGVGKSLVISALFQVLSQFFNSTIESTPDYPSVLLCAPTGKAAFNIQGQTLHSAFRLPVNQNNLNELSSDVSNTMATKLAKLKVVIIDECSMVGQRTLEMVDERLRHLFHDKKPFGGISIILCGDFFQLKPVFSRPLYHPLQNNPYGEIFGQNPWHSFKVFRLTRIMRQSEVHFQTALNNMAVGSMTTEDIQLIKSREFETVPKNLPRAIHLFPTNDAVDAYNEEALNDLPGDRYECDASDIVSGFGSAAAVRQIQYSAKNSKKNETMGIPNSVILKVGALYMVTYNVDTSDGLANGVCGELKRIDFGTNGEGDKKPLRIWIKFEDERIGSKQRTKFANLMCHLKISSSWTPIEPIAVKIKTKKNSSLELHRKQFPICLGHALTIHKSQGMSLPLVVVHLKGRMSRPLLYVACSRATSLNGLHLIGSFIPPPPISSQDYLNVEMTRWLVATLTPRFQFLRNSQPDVQVMYHNVQSLPKHWPLVKNDFCFKKSHIICLAETWTTSNDDYYLDNFLLCERIDNQTARKARGVWLYTHVKLQPFITGSGKRIFSLRRGRLELCWVSVLHTTFIALYASPKSSTDLFSVLFAFIEQVATTNVVVLGDFNVNSAVATGLPKSIRLSSFRIKNIGQPTTRRNTALDWVMSNCDLECGTYASFASYHNPIWARVSHEIV